MGRTGTPQHYSGTASTTGVLVPLARGKLAQSIVIRNLDATNDLLVAFTGGGKYYTIPKGQSEHFDCTFQQFWVQAGASTVAWCAVTTEG